MKETVLSSLKEIHDLIAQVSSDNILMSNIQRMAETIVKQLKNGHKVVLFGNGGSASDAQHICAEFVGRFETERNPIPAISIPCNVSNLTAIGNDYGFEKVFSRQVQALVNEGDIVIGFSTSGNSQNVIEALNTAREKKAFCYGMAGENNSKMDQCCDITLHVPSQRTARIQECHIIIGHILCECVDLEYEI